MRGDNQWLYIPQSKMIVQALYFLIECKPSPEKDGSQTATVVAIIVFSLVFLTLVVLLGVVGL